MERAFSENLPPLNRYLSRSQGGVVHERGSKGSHEGAAKVQELIDAGAYLTWTEQPSGLEMIAEFQREVGGETSQTRSMQINRESFFVADLLLSLALPKHWANVSSVVLLCESGAS